VTVLCKTTNFPECTTNVFHKFW